MTALVAQCGKARPVRCRAGRSVSKATGSVSTPLVLANDGFIYQGLRAKRYLLGVPQGSLRHLDQIHRLNNQ
jgi:hypothetical protein